MIKVKTQIVQKESSPLQKALDSLVINNTGKKKEPTKNKKKKLEKKG